MIEHQSPSIFCPTIAGSFHLRGPSRCRPAGGRKAEQKGFSSESAAFKQSSCRFRGTLPFMCPWPRLCHLATSCFKEGRRIQSFFSWTAMHPAKNQHSVNKDEEENRVYYSTLSKVVYIFNISRYEYYF